MVPAPSNPRPRGRRRFALVAGAATLVAGCAGRPTPSDAPASPVVAGDQPAAAAPADLSARSASVEVARRAVYRSRGTGADSYLLIERSEPEAAASGRTEWIVRRWHGPGPEGPWIPATEQQFVLTEAGDAAIAGETNHVEKVGLAFTPPMVVMPARLAAGSGPFTQATSLRVWPLENPRQTKAQGAVRQEIRHAGAEMIETPGGSVLGQRIEQVFEADLKPAQVRNLTRQWFVPGTGLIAETREERTRVFGVPTRQNRESWVLLDKP